MDAALAQEVVDDVFDALDAVGAIYVFDDGDPLPCKVILHRTRQDRQMAGLSFRSGLAVATRGVAVLVRATEVAAPAEGGVFTPGSTVGGVFVPGPHSYRVGEGPISDDVHGLVWRCACDPGDGQ